MAQATKQGTNYERIFNEEYLVKIKNKESLQDRVAVQVLDQGTLVGELKVKANTLLNGTHSLTETLQLVSLRLVLNSKRAPST